LLDFACRPNNADMINPKNYEKLSSRKSSIIVLTLFKSENEWQKTEQVPIPLLMASRNFPNVKVRNEMFFYN
jgi:hypothetical protein